MKLTTNYEYKKMKQMFYRVEESCRGCDGELEDVMDYGTVPLADRLVDAERLEEDRWQAPLTLCRCQRCGLVQIRETVDPAILFYSDYPYFSSVSPALREHFSGTYEAITKRKSLTDASLVVEAASNDGCLLSFFMERGIPVLGIDPASAPVKRAMCSGIPTRKAFFGESLAEELASNGAYADVFIGTNVLAHVSDLKGFVRGVKRILRPDGIAVFEVPWLVQLVCNGEFDTVYHQHLCYFSLTSLVLLFRSLGLSVGGVELLAIHGGSLRIFVGHDAEDDGSLGPILTKEAALGVCGLGFVKGLERKAQKIRSDLLEALDSMKGRGLQVAGYGAAAKATTLLSYCGLGVGDLEFVVDLNRFKQGKSMPGSQLPILSPKAIVERQPDALLILAWNFADEIMSQLSDYTEGGGRFLVPIPELQIFAGQESAGMQVDTAHILKSALGAANQGRG